MSIHQGRLTEFESSAEFRTGDGATVAPVPPTAKRMSGNFSRRVASSQKSTPQGHDNATDD